MRINEILKLFSESDNLNYPVVNKNSELAGIISVENIKSIIDKMELSEFLLAHDIMEPVIASSPSDISIFEVQELIKHYNLEYMPVVDDDKVVGLIESRNIQRYVSFKLLELQQKISALD